MKKYLLLLALLFLQPLILYTQKLATVSGRLIDQNGNGLSSLQLKLYISPTVYNTTSNSEGVFVFDSVTDLLEEKLPIGYGVTNNYPNPFNPRTRIGIALPNSGRVTINVYNLLGQRMEKDIEKYMNAGNSYIDLELDGLPTGFYLAKITLDGKYVVTKKLMLMYGSQHLSPLTGGFVNFINKKILKNNSILYTKIDSLVVTGFSIIKKVFTNLPNLTSDALNLGELMVERICPGVPQIIYAGITYNTVLIGNQCWLKENLNLGIMILGNQNASNNSFIEKYCYNNDSVNCNAYGGLYQWNEAMRYVTTPGATGICPTGWHIPTRVEFETLANRVNNSGNALKSIGQGIGGGSGTNTSGFSALLSGYRGNDSNFSYFGNHTRIWGSTEDGSTGANFIHLYYNLSNIGFGVGGDKDFGYSVRCLKD